jgi:hypothetical protein
MQKRKKKRFSREKAKAGAVLWEYIDRKHFSNTSNKKKEEKKLFPIRKKGIK